MVKTVQPPIRPRLRKRRLDAEELAAAVAESAKQNNKWMIRVFLGDSVSNSYGYPAETECAVVIADPHGMACLWYGRCRANNPTKVAACLGCGLRATANIFDGRVTRSEVLDRAWKEAKDLHSKAWNPLEIIAESCPDANERI